MHCHALHYHAHTAVLQAWPAAPSMNVMFVALGRHHGVCHIGSLVSKRLLPRLKSRDLWVGSTRRQIGARERPGPEDPADRVPSTTKGIEGDAGAVRISSVSL